MIIYIYTGSTWDIWRGIEMTELKTLKDLWMIDGKKPVMTYTNEDVVFVEDLRQEAIKWVKKGMEDYEIEEHREIDAAITLWIKTFFNITEEELK